MSDGVNAKVVILYNRVPEIMASLKPKRDAILAKTAFDVQAGSQSNVHVDTGACKNSHYVVLYGMSTYGGAAEAAKAANPKVNVLPSPQAPNEGEAYIVVGVDYAWPLESRYPYLTPAAGAQRGPFIEAMSRIVP